MVLQTGDKQQNELTVEQKQETKEAFDLLATAAHGSTASKAFQGSGELRAVLEHLRLDRYLDAFLQNGWDDLQDLRECDAESLQSVLQHIGLPPGHQLRLSRHLLGAEASTVPCFLTPPPER